MSGLRVLHAQTSSPEASIFLPRRDSYASPQPGAKVGRPYNYQAKSLRSLGDYQCKLDPTSKRKAYAYKFWDIEETSFKLIEGPTWLALDEKTGLLSGTPGVADVGTATVKLEIATQFGAGAGQEFRLSVVRQ